jgi:hypothetical protein
MPEPAEPSSALLTRSLAFGSRNLATHLPDEKTLCSTLCCTVKLQTLGAYLTFHNTIFLIEVFVPSCIKRNNRTL